MWMPPDLGNQYARELERKQREEAHQRQQETGRPSYLLRKFHLGIGQKLTLLGFGFLAVVALLMLAAALT
jgi:hypothetical protein